MAFVAQLTMWFGTAGAALAVQIAMFMLGAAELIQDSVKLALLMQ